MMADPPDETLDVASDAALWTLLRRHVAERAPEDMRAAARGALAWRDPEGALAALVSDSAAVGAQAPSRVRGLGQPRLLAFAAADLSIVVEVSWRDGAVNLIGQLAPVGPAAVEADHPGGVVAATTDDLGRFWIGDIEPGLVRLRCTPEASGTPVHTEWVLL